MTKKHYTAVAKIINKRLNEKQTAPIGEYEVVEVLALDLAHFFRDENPRFNEDRFLEACYTGKLKTI
jgi:hypothetical protein